MRRASMLSVLVLAIGMIGVAVPVVPAAAATSVVINFDDLPEGGSTGVLVTNQYPAATFSSTAGNANFVSTQPVYNASQPNLLCSGPAAGPITCVDETIVSFATPVTGLTFNALGVNNTGTVAQIDLFTQAGLVATVPVVGQASGLDPELQDLSSYVGLTSIRIYNITDGGGIGWDDFSFTQQTDSDSLVTSMTGTPDPVTAGNNVQYTVTVQNNGASAVSGVQITDTLPATTTFVSASTGCVGTGPVTCSLGTIGPSSSASATIVVKTSSSSGGTTVTNSATTSPGGSSAHFDTHIVAPTSGTASGYVPPGGSISNGGANPATLSLPNSGPGAAVTLTQGTGNFCGGPCVGPATEVNNFPGYSNPTSPISLTLAYAEPNLARSLIDFATATLYYQSDVQIVGVKIRDCLDNPAWTAQQKRAAALRRTLRVGTQSGIANPSPCVDSRKIVALPGNKWQVAFTILYLSGDPRFARR